jgi:hypothetical protein
MPSSEQTRCERSTGGRLVGTPYPEVRELVD